MSQRFPEDVVELLGCMRGVLKRRSESRQQPLGIIVGPGSTHLSTLCVLQGRWQPLHIAMCVRQWPTPCSVRLPVDAGRSGRVMQRKSGEVGSGGYVVSWFLGPGGRNLSVVQRRVVYISAV